MDDGIVAALESAHAQLSSAGESVEELQTLPTAEAAADESPAPVTESEGDNEDLASDQAQLEEVETQPTGEPLKAPSDWSESAKAAFSKAPPEVQQALIDRTREMQADYTRKTQEVANTRKRVEAIENVVSPYTQYLASKGMMPDQAIRALLDKQVALDTNPASVIAQLIRENAVTPEQIAPYLQQSSGYNDPAIQQLTQELLSVKSYVHSQEQAKADYEATTVLTTFQSEKDAFGNPKRPHWDAVKELLPALVSTIEADDPSLSSYELLERAYAVAEKPIKAAQRAAIEQRQKKVAAAKIAGSSVTSSPGVSSAPKKPLSVLDAITQANDQLSSRR